MKLKKLLTSLFSLTFVSCAFGQSSFEEMSDKMVKKWRAPTVDIKSLKSEMAGKDVVILDAREPAEYKVSHIPGAKYVGYEKFDSSMVVKSIPKNSKVIVYCSVGYRSGEIADKLNKLGYQAKNLKGGIFAWVNNGNRIVDRSNTQTSKIHGYDKSWAKWLTKGEIVY